MILILQIQLQVLYFQLFQFSSVSQSCPTLCDSINCSTPGLPVHHQLLEFAQTHVYRVYLILLRNVCFQFQVHPLVFQVFMLLLNFNFWLLLLCINSVDFCIFILYITTFINPFLLPTAYFCIYCVIFYIDGLVFCKGSFTYSFCFCFTP